MTDTNLLADVQGLIVKQALKIQRAVIGDPVDEWVDTLDEYLKRLVDNTNILAISDAISEASREDRTAGSLILERSIVLARSAAAWEFAE